MITIEEIVTISTQLMIKFENKYTEYSKPKTQ